MSESRSEVVLRAATRIFLRHGFSAATTDMIQSEAQVSKATVYAHYANKEALFAAVIQHACAELTAAVRAIQPAAGQLPDKLREIGRAYLALLLSPEGLGLFRVVVSEAPRFPDLARLFYLAGPQVIHEVAAGHLRAAAAAGEVDLQAVGVDQAAGLFLSLLRGEGHLECLTHPQAVPSSAQVDQWVTIALTTFMAAFGRQKQAVN